MGKLCVLVGTQKYGSREQPSHVKKYLLCDQSSSISKICSHLSTMPPMEPSWISTRIKVLPHWRQSDSDC